MANNSSKKTNNKNNKTNSAKKSDTTKKVSTSKSTNTKNSSSTKKNEKVKVTPKEEIKVEKIIEKTEPEVKKNKKSFKLTSKQRDIVLVLLVAVVLIIAIVITGGNSKLDIELPIKLEGEAGFNEITYAEYEEKLSTEAPFLVIIVRDGCGYCEMYEPIVEEVADEYKLPINYINLSNLTSDEKVKLSTSNSYLKSTQWGTPTTLFMYGKTVVDSIGQYVDKDTFVEFVKENFVVE